MLILFCWIIVAVVICISGRLLDNKILLGIGAAMTISMAAVANVAY